RPLSAVRLPALIGSICPQWSIAGHTSACEASVFFSMPGYSDSLPFRSRQSATSRDRLGSTDFSDDVQIEAYLRSNSKNDLARLDERGHLLASGKLQLRGGFVGNDRGDRIAARQADHRFAVDATFQNLGHFALVLVAGAEAIVAGIGQQSDRRGLHDTD